MYPMMTLSIHSDVRRHGGVRGYVSDLPHMLFGVGGERDVAKRVSNIVSDTVILISLHYIT